LTLTRLRRAVLTLAVSAALWSALVALTGGVAFDLLGVRVRSRTPGNPIVISLLLAAVAAALWRFDRSRNARGELHWWKTRFEAPSFAHFRYGPTVAAVLTGIACQVALWVEARPLWLDEQMIALNIRDQPLAGLAGPLWLGQSAPFGWLLLQRGSVAAFGPSELALRIVPSLFYVGTIVAAFAVGARWLGAVGTAVLVLLCTFGEWVFFNALEVKHYSSDALGALLLLGAGVALVPSRSEPPAARRLAAWWGLAAVAQWFSNGAMLAAPGCAVALAALLWKRHGIRHALLFAWAGAIWLASFALHYEVSLRHTLDSSYLQGYWAPMMPPPLTSAGDALDWVSAQLRPIARNPVGTTLWEILWLFTAAGFLLGARPAIGIPAAAVTLSAFVLAAAQIVPLYGRLSLWIAPAVYLGVALAIGRAVPAAADAFRARRWIPFAAAAAIAWLGVQLCVDLVDRGLVYFAATRGTVSNHALDDRAAVAWLLGHRRPGDAIVTTQPGLPAIWWYGEVNLANGDVARLADGTPVLEADVAPDAECPERSLRRALQGRRRALVYLGFGFEGSNDLDRVLLAAATEHGKMVSLVRFAEIGRVAVIDLTATHPGPSDAEAAGEAAVRPCVVARPAAVW
jgi:hypothetical protein